MLPEFETLSCCVPNNRSVAAKQHARMRPVNSSFLNEMRDPLHALKKRSQRTEDILRHKQSRQARQGRLLLLTRFIAVGQGCLGVTGTETFIYTAQRPEPYGLAESEAALEVSQQNARGLYDGEPPASSWLS